MQLYAPPLATRLRDALQTKIDQKTKPVGALGQLESIASQVGCIQQSLSPSLNQPHVLVFAADHGIAHENVSAYPQTVTAQMVDNFLSGGAAINTFTRQHGLAFKLVDAGVAADLKPHPNLISAKVAYGTDNFAHSPAMTQKQCRQAIDTGARIMNEVINNTDCNIVGFGEMGIANTTAASALMACITGIDTQDCVGRGTGLNNQQLTHKQKVVMQALVQHKLSSSSDAQTILATFGGFEIAMMVGAMFAAAQHHCTIIIDGFIVTSALLVAKAIDVNIQDYCLFAHCSDEAPHQALLDYLGAKPILTMGLRLGEGSGAALAYPLIDSAVRFLNEMATFESANVSQQS